MILPTLFFCLLNRAHAFGPPSIQYNDDGIRQYQGEDYASAFDNFAKALGRDSFNPSFHLNLGDAFYKNQDLQKAISEYEVVDKNPKATKEQKFKALFNAGNAQIAGKQIPQALQYYQRALELNPDSVEVKTNIELALQQQKKGGGGESKDKDQKDKKDGQNKDDKQQQDQKKQDQNKDQKPDQNQQQRNANEPKPRPTPHGFKSQALNENDVRRILEELKRQEEEIRAKQYKERRDTPEQNIEKDW
jgi:Ca-activated chloride channel family protein